MDILFIHQNFPGQFRHLSHQLAKAGHRVVALGDTDNLKKLERIPHVHTVGYPTPPAANGSGHFYLFSTENAIRRGQAVVRACLALQKEGLRPEVVVVHAGWGEGLFLREVFPRAKIMAYFEYYYQAKGGDVDFDPEFAKSSLDDLCRLRVRNTTHLLTLQACDMGWSPTRWQASRFPEPHASQMLVVHEGIDTQLVQPASQPPLEVAGKTFAPEDEVITYVARNLEPYRGFHQLMRLLPEVLHQRPRAQVIIVGGDGVSYGKPPPQGENWRTFMLQEVGDRLDRERVHFTGKLPYLQYLKVLQRSNVHLYWSYPFVLSWSLMEAMAAGCAIVASRTPPVEEVIQDGVQGHLVDFFAKENWIQKIVHTLEGDNKAMRQAARATIQENYDLHQKTLPLQLQRFYELAGKR
ncbi:MAG: glycosyltransferase [Magnetococcales bacterium]|nr:glycosyltransferase [Magnetococcales bacterium]NGZ25440.1 glycosyltransferase [Magnetococcales bacterium]